MSLIKTVENNKVVLFASSSPVDRDRIRASKEFELIFKSRKDHKISNNTYDIQPRFELNPESFMTVCRECKPHVLHFSGHGWFDGDIIFQDSITHSSRPVSARVFGRLFVFHKEVELVFLNSCFSIEQAEEINKFLKNGYVVAMTDKISSELAIHFAQHFYSQLFESDNIVLSFAYAQLYLEMVDTKKKAIPVLFKNGKRTNGEELDSLIKKSMNPEKVIQKFKETRNKILKLNLGVEEERLELQRHSIHRDFLNFFFQKRKKLSFSVAKEVLTSYEEEDQLLLGVEVSKMFEIVYFAMLTDNREGIDLFDLEGKFKQEFYIESIKLFLVKISKYPAAKNKESLSKFKHFIGLLLNEI